MQRKKSIKPKIISVSNRSHKKSPHVLSVKKTHNGIEVTHGHELKSKSSQVKTDISLDELIDTRTQFTKSTELKTKNRENQMNIDLVNKSGKILLDNEISIEKELEDAFRIYASKQFAYGAANNNITQARIEKNHVIHVSHPTKHHVIRTTIMFALAGILVCAPLYTARFVAHAQYTKEALSELSNGVFSAFKKAENGVLHGQTNEISSAFNEAQAEFAHAVYLLKSFERDTTLIASTIPPVRKQVKAAQAITQAGLHITSSISILTKNLDEISIDNFELLSKTLDSSISELELAHKEIQRVSPDFLPHETRPLFINLKDEFDKLMPALLSAKNTAQTFAKLMTQYPRQTILVLFQNNNEIRATGGFWGSFALVTLINGKIDSIDVPGGGTYDLQGSLDRHMRPPSPLQLVRSEWQFQDANWFPDFPTSAEAATWFLEHSKYGTPDATIAITPNVLESILSITGPIEITEFNKTVDANNVIYELQKSVEIEYDRTENKPKKIIGVLLAKLFDLAPKLDASKKIGMLSVLNESLAKKDILVHHRNSEMQSALLRAGWTGSINQTWDNDYLMIVNHNIAGQKTDGVISQDIIKTTTIHDNGSITSEITIRRTHEGKKGDLFSGVRNVNYMRIFTPKGSELVRAEGFTYPDENYFKSPDTYETHKLISDIERTKITHAASGTHITTETGKTVFGNWTMTDPGETTVVKLTYRLPFLATSKPRDSIIQSLSNETSTYKLLLQKQPGAKNTMFTHSINIPKSWNVIESTDENQDLVESFPLERDIISGIVMTRAK